MAINIIIDKSTFQSLSYGEMLRLTYYYKHNITPLLVLEILGDLKKEAKEGKTPSHERVIDFATKLFPSNTIVNQHYTSPLKGELTGNGSIQMDGRPLIGGKPVQTEDGKKGWMVEETAEEKAIYDWREGKFIEADHVLSKVWRDTTKREDLLVNMKKELDANGRKTCIENFQQLDQFVTQTLDNPINAQQLLIDLCKTSEIDVMRTMAILTAWQRSGKPQLKYFIPFAYHILRVNSLFQVGLQCDLISTRPTNKVDLEYLYYLPFCQVFTSNDKLHLNLAPLLLRKDQHFIKGTDLKEDIHRIIEELAQMSEDQKEEFRKAPPVNQDSFTFQRYHEYFDYPDGRQWKVKSILKKEEALRMMKSFEKANDVPGIEMKSGDDGMFMSRITWMGRNDPCTCGSGKRLIECCLSEEQFTEALKAQGAKKSFDKIKIGSANWLGKE